MTVAELLHGRNTAGLAPSFASERLRFEVDCRKQTPMPFRDYIREAWRVVEPSTPYIHGWHIDAIAEHLEAVNRGEIRNLLINIPPRHMKSLLVSVFWPTWVWTWNPVFRWLYASYAQTLATRDSLKCRRIIESSWYQSQWGRMFRLTSDQNQKMRFDNDRTGYRLATSAGGSATGEGGDVIVCDDPHNVQDGESDAERQSVLTWWDEVMSTRLNDPRTGVKVIVMQRINECDLSGHVLVQGGYEHLMLPTEYEPKRSTVTVIGWRDPRSEEGELLCAERFGSAEVKDAQLTLGSYGYAGQHQQRPAPRGGGMFKRDWFPIIDALPADKPISDCRGWDAAATEGGGDYSVGVRITRYRDGTSVVRHVVRGQWSSGKLDMVMRQTAAADGLSVRQREEQEPGSAGKAVIDARKRALVGYGYRGVRATGNKETRAEPFAIQAEAGNVKVLRGPWNQAYLDELEKFPASAHDDQVDGSSTAFNDLARTFRWVPVT